MRGLIRSRKQICWNSSRIVLNASGGSALSNVAKELRQFHKFLESTNKLTIPRKRAFMFPIIQEKKILPAFSWTDIETVIGQIDRAKDKGKRDYAIIQLGITTGLRACDIEKLKLRGIDWRKGELHILQRKTKPAPAIVF